MWPGRCIQPGHETRFMSSTAGSVLAKAASPPGKAAAATTPSASTTAATASSAAAATAAATASSEAAAAARELDPASGFGVLLVEDIESRQADVGNLFLAEHDLVIEWKVWQPRQILRRHHRGLCAARQRKRQTGGSKHRPCCLGRVFQSRRFLRLRLSHIRYSVTGSRFKDQVEHRALIGSNGWCRCD